jgi:pimeloyl-ACP methyl ester carboxylesterase
VRKVLASVDGPVVLVAHGLGGGVASEVGTDPGVSALVFIAATAPEAGEDPAPLFARFLVGASQPPGAAAPPIEGKAAMAGWREKPGFYAVFTQSEALSPELQRFFAARMNAKTIVFDDGPSAMESHAREIAGLILEAAGQKPPACGAAGDGRKGACAAPALPRSLMKGCKCTKGSLEDLTKP